MLVFCYKYTTFINFEKYGFKILREFDNETHISKCISNGRYHFHFHSRMLKSLSLALMLYLLVEPCMGCYITEQYIPDHCHCTDDYRACNRNCEDYCLGEKCTDPDGQKYCYKKCNRTLLFCVMDCLGKFSQSFYEKLCEKNEQEAIKYTLKFDKSRKKIVQVCQNKSS